MSIAFVFPGQGSQAVGMGKELADHFPAAKAVFDRAARVLGQEYVDVIFSGPEEKLRQTKFTQPALFIVSMAALEVVKTSPLKPVLAAGHSLGEYSALCAAGAFDFETGLNLVKRRGEALQEASDKIPGTMAAIVGLERAKVEEICAQAGAQGVCEAVNFNCPGQIVLAGAGAAIEEAVRLAQAAGSPKSVRLNVSGPFHSSLMKPAAEKMAAVLEFAPFNDAAIPVVANCDAQPTQKAEDIKAKLLKQIDHPVYWEETLRVMFAQGVDTFVEVGPGRVLSGLLRRTDKTKKFRNIEDKKSADALLAPAVSS
ncbi:MAG TPA: ACP S-malonyltransferase [Elusimicrobiota bacterium]|nr:ACP S-malonyltransferase [Elusimicrobiota bacterium]